jgi:hypothetical protein
MATKPQSIQLEIQHFNAFKQYVPLYSGMCERTIESLLNMGMIQVSTCFEHALGNVSNTKVVNENHCDLSDGSDAKLCSTHIHRGKCDTHVSNITGKTGKLRVQVYEQQTAKIYWFVIPYKAYSHLKVLEIGFNIDGSPNRGTKWWQYEVDTFKKLAKS